MYPRIITGRKYLFKAAIVFVAERFSIHYPKWSTPLFLAVVINRKQSPGSTFACLAVLFASFIICSFHLFLFLVFFCYFYFLLSLFLAFLYFLFFPLSLPSFPPPFITSHHWPWGQLFLSRLVHAYLSPSSLGTPLETAHMGWVRGLVDGSRRWARVAVWCLLSPFTWNDNSVPIS